VHAADVVTIGSLKGLSSFVTLLADEKGYFRERGIQVDFVDFDSGAKMIPSLSTGDVMVGLGAVSSALFNASKRQLNVKIVAGAVRNAPGAGQSLLVRSDLRVSSVNSVKDLAGRKIAITSPASADAASLDLVLRSAGLTIRDVDTVPLGFPQQIAALSNKAIDAALVGEPFATLAARAKIASRLVAVSDIFPDRESAVMVFGDAMLRRGDDLPVRFLAAYLTGARYYMEAQANGRLAGPKGEDVAEILSRRSSITDRALIVEMRPFAVDTDGKLNMSSIKYDYEYFRANGQAEPGVDVEAMVEPRYAAAAARSIAQR
jgi:NitT/TauT family transport system substrate-binding protein